MLSVQQRRVGAEAVGRRERIGTDVGHGLHDFQPHRIRRAVDDLDDALLLEGGVDDRDGVDVAGRRLGDGVGAGVVDQAPPSRGSPGSRFVLVQVTRTLS